MKGSSQHIGVFEAKTRFSELLERVGRGASFTITKHNRPVARLSACESDRTSVRAEATAALRNLRTRYRLDGVDSRNLRNEGRA